MCENILKETGVALLPGSDFGFSEKKMLARLSFTDFEGKTIIWVSSNEKNLKGIIKKGDTKTDISKLIGSELAKRAKKKKLSNIVLDRNGYPYHGRVEAFAKGVRSEGLKF